MLNTQNHEVSQSFYCRSAIIYRQVTSRCIYARSVNLSLCVGHLAVGVAHCKWTSEHTYR